MYFHRTALNIKMEGALDQANSELRVTMKNIWNKRASDKGPFRYIEVGRCVKSRQN